MRTRTQGFTLIELMVVLLIIGILAAVSLPALKGIGQSNTMTSATRQLLDDLALARHKAITTRTVVHVVFVPEFASFSQYTAPTRTADQDVFERVKSGSQTTYALFAERSVGDQPGQRTARYLTKWRSLPDGIFIASPEFDTAANNWDRPFERWQLPFPTATSPVQVSGVPHVAFDQNGSLLRFDAAGVRVFDNEFVWLTRGSVLASYDKGFAYEVDVRESPPGNWTNNYHRIFIDGVTGRAKLERLEIQ